MVHKLVHFSHSFLVKKVVKSGHVKKKCHQTNRKEKMKKLFRCDSILRAGSIKWFIINRTSINKSSEHSVLEERSTGPI